MLCKLSVGTGKWNVACNGLCDSRSFVVAGWGKLQMLPPFRHAVFAVKTSCFNGGSCAFSQL